MDSSFKELLLKFISIKNKGWIKSLRKPPSGIGYTFETLINKEEDHTEFPDYKDIEIKTMNYYSSMPIHLFCLTPDGDYLFPMKRVIEILGYPDRDYPQFKVINVSINTQYYKRIGNKIVKLNVLWKEQKIVLDVKNIYGQKIDVYVSWSFQSIEERVKLKLNKLAIIKAYHKKINNIDYYKYAQLNYYILKSLNNFIKSIDEGFISISFHVGIQKNDQYLGQINDRGTNFTITKENIEKIFKKL